MAEPGFWDDPEASKGDIERLKLIRAQIEPIESVRAKLDELEATEELIREDGGEEFVDEAFELVRTITHEIDQIDLQLMFDGQYDHRSAYLSVHAGSGGTEACDWTRMLLRMYTRWCELEGFKMETLETLTDDESGGIRSAQILVRGPYAYGLLKAEIGVHRLVRISPFDANKRRHTSFASVDVSPELPEDLEVEIDETELRIDTYRSGGAGGQHVNTTDSAVRITHLPTNTVVQCQNERSQHKNKATAMKMLKAKLVALQEMEREAELRKLSGAKGEIGFGHQIRSYVFQPYTMVKDHRTGLETGNVQAVMDGEIRQFLESYLRSRGQSNSS